MTSSPAHDYRIAKKGVLLSGCAAAIEKGQRFLGGVDSCSEQSVREGELKNTPHRRRRHERYLVSGLVDEPPSCDERVHSRGVHETDTSGVDDQGPRAVSIAVARSLLAITRPATCRRLASYPSKMPSTGLVYPPVSGAARSLGFSLASGPRSDIGAQLTHSRAGPSQ